MHRWYESEETNTGIIIGGQVCFVRNIEGYPFTHKMDADAQKQLLDTVREAAASTEQVLGQKLTFYPLAEMKEIDRQALIGRLAIVPGLYVKNYQAGLLLSEDASVSILVNGKEHICVQVSCAGGHIQEAVQKAYAVDDSLNRHLTYAFSKKYGYLTASPLYTGTGMTASYLMHLPYLEHKKLIGQLEKELSQYGFSLRAAFKGQAQAPGNIYQLKNRKTLGLSENEMISALENMTGQIVDQEQKISDRVLSTNRLEEENKLYRAYGLLKYARELGYDETMMYLSYARIGDLKDIWQSETQVGRFAMMLGVQDAVLSADRDGYVSGSECGSVRAAYIQQHLADILTE